MNSNSGGHRFQFQEKKKLPGRASQSFPVVPRLTNPRWFIQLAPDGGAPLLQKGKSGSMPTAPIAMAMFALNGLMPIPMEIDR